MRCWSERCISYIMFHFLIIDARESIVLSMHVAALFVSDIGLCPSLRTSDRAKMFSVAKFSAENYRQNIRLKPIWQKSAVSDISK
jgi:hypothetical protein